MLEIPAEATVVLLAYSKLDFYPKGAVEHSACYGWILLLCPPEFLMKHRTIAITNGKGTGLGKTQTDKTLKYVQ